MTTHPTPPPTGQAVTERLAAVQAEHQYLNRGPARDRCSGCDWVEPDGAEKDRRGAHRIHVAEIQAGLVAAEVAAAEVRALREASEMIRSAYTADTCPPDFKAGMIAARLVVEVHASDRIAEGVRADG